MSKINETWAQLLHNDLNGNDSRETQFCNSKTRLHFYTLTPHYICCSWFGTHTWYPSIKWTILSPTLSTLLESIRTSYHLVNLYNWPEINFQSCRHWNWWKLQSGFSWFYGCRAIRLMGPGLPVLVATCLGYGTHSTTALPRAGRKYYAVLVHMEAFFRVASCPIMALRVQVGSGPLNYSSIVGEPMLSWPVVECARLWCGRQSIIV